MIKRLLVGLVLLLVIAFGLGYFYLGTLAKSGIEYGGEYALKTSVDVDSVTLSPLNGHGSIRGLTIANPAGYSGENAFELAVVEVEVNVASVFSELVEINLLRIAQPQINYEAKLGEDNLRALMANLPSGDSAPSASEPSEPGKQVLLKRVEILGSQLSLVTALGSTPITLPDIVLNDIGGPGQGASIAEAAETVISELLASIAAANIPDLEQLKDEVEEKARQELEKIEQDLGDKVQESLGTSVEDLSNRLRNLRN